MKKYLNPVLRWWWLIILCTLVAGVSCYFIVRRMPPIYEVHATMIVGRSLNSANPSSGEFYLEQQLASVYATIGSQGQLNGPTMEALGLASLPEYYVRPVANTPIIDIAVTDTDPVRAQAVANELADQLAKSGPSSSNSEIKQRQTFINEQLDKLQAEITDTEDRIEEANQQLAEANSARKIAEIQDLIAALEEKYTTLQNSYTNLLSNTEQGATNIITVAQYASLPTQPVGPRKTLFMVLASGMGMALATMAAYFIELLDTRIKHNEEMAELLGAPILGELPVIPRNNEALYTARHPRSPITDAFRSLRTNIEFLGINEPLRTVLVTSTDASGGKTTVASNLAIMFAKGGKKVIVIDADLRRSSIHKLFDINREPGISDVCVGRTDLFSALRPWSSADLDGDENNHFYPKDAELLRVLPAGTPPPNPAELMSSARFDKILEELTKHADLIIIDSPPIFLPDTTTLFPKVGGILLVVEPGRTNRNSIQAAKDQINRSGARLLGIAVNRSRIFINGYQRYQSEEEANKSIKRRLNLRLSDIGLSKSASAGKASMKDNS